MALDQLKAFILKMQQDDVLKQTVLAASTADDVAKIAARQGFEFSGDELLRFNGKKVGQVIYLKNTCRGWCIFRFRPTYIFNSIYFSERY